MTRLYIVILDKVPEIAASYLTKGDATRTFHCLTKIIDNYISGRERHWVLRMNEITFNWYMRFYTELGNLLGIHVDTDELPSFTGEPRTSNLILHRHRASDSFIHINELRKLDKRRGLNAINYNRAFYILKNYIASDFITKRVPCWYVCRSRVLWEGRDLETMCRVRVVKDDATGVSMQTELEYNNWKTTKIVDPEIAKLIRALLKNATLVD